MGVNELFGLNDLEEGGNKDKLFFPENIPVKMAVVSAKDGVLESGYNYYVLQCSVLDGDFKGEDYDLFINTKYKNKAGEEKGTYAFKKVLGGLCKEFSKLEISEGRGNDLVESFKTQLDRIIGKNIEIAFFKPERGYQNLIYVKDLDKENSSETTKTTESKREDF